LGRLELLARLLGLPRRQERLGLVEERVGRGLLLRVLLGEGRRGRERHEERNHEPGHAHLLIRGLQRVVGWLGLLRRLRGRGRRGAGPVGAVSRACAAAAAAPWPRPRALRRGASSSARLPALLAAVAPAAPRARRRGRRPRRAWAPAAAAPAGARARRPARRP